MTSCISTLVQISRVKHIFKNELITIINALVFSKLYYCSSVWSNTTMSNVIHENMIILDWYLRNLNGYLSKITYIYYRDATLAFKCMTGLALNYLCNKFICRGDVSKRNTRNSHLLNIPLFKTTTGQRSFLYRVVNIWNNLPTDIKFVKMLQVLKLN